jgi:two-component system, NarL family, nitrate/nitrite response regulator NarL
MEPEERRATLMAHPTETALVISDVKFLCDSIAEIVARIPGVRSCNCADTIEAALLCITASLPAIVLIDVALPQGKQVAVQICQTYAAVNVIALGVRETKDDVLGWVEAGIAGYVPNTSSVMDMLALIEQIRRGEQRCTAKIAGSLLRRISDSSRRPQTTATSTEILTRREQEVLTLVNAGLSNKDIARRLRISLSTTKTHVHHVLGKMKATRRSTVIAASNAAPGRRPDAHPL